MACSLLLAAILLPGREALPAPTSSRDAEAAVKGWLRRSVRPLGCRLGGAVKKVVTFKDDSGMSTYSVVYLRPSGFVIVPADDDVEPIVAFASSGTYDPSPKNPLGALVSRDLLGRVATARKAGGPAMKRRAPRAAVKWRWVAGGVAPQAEGDLPSVSDERVPPLVQSQWSQSTVNGEA